MGKVHSPNLSAEAVDPVKVGLHAEFSGVGGMLLTLNPQQAFREIERRAIDIVEWSNSVFQRSHHIRRFTGVGSHISRGLHLVTDQGRHPGVLEPWELDNEVS